MDPTKSRTEFLMRIVVQNNDGTISKMVEADQKEFTDTTTGKVGTKTTGDVATPAPIPAHTSFSDAFMKWEGVMIPQYDQHYNMAKYMEYLLEHGAKGLNLRMDQHDASDLVNFQEFIDLEAGNRTAFTSAFFDTPGYFDDRFGVVGSNDGLYRRRGRWGHSAPNLVSYDLSDWPALKEQKFIPPGMNIDIIKMIGNPNQFLITASPTKTYKLQVLAANIIVHMIKLTPEGLVQNHQRLNRKPTVYRYLQPTISVHPILIGTKVFELQLGDAEHALPQLVHFCFLAEDALIGNHGKNCFEMIMPKFDNVKMKSNEGEVFLDISTYSHTAEQYDTTQLYRHFRLDQDSAEMRTMFNSLPKWIWEKGYGIWT